MSWNNNSISYHDYVKSNWKNNILDNKTWNQALHDGVFENKNSIKSRNSFVKDINKNSGYILALASSIQDTSDNTFELNLYSKTGMGDGQCANNPWLQEFPDPITRTTWDNYLTMSAATARELGVTNWNISNGALNGNMVNITVKGVTYNNVPVMIQPGQAVGTVAMAVGYGRTAAGKCGNDIGFNAFTLGNGEATIDVVGGEYGFAAVQLHHTMMGRDIVKETTLADFIKDPKSGNQDVTYATHDGHKTGDKVSLWDEFDHSTGHFWNMSIDLTSCIGCAACVVSCHAENNVPVVGKEEIRRSRDMHWLRIDRYYSSEDSFEKDDEKKDNIKGLGSSLSSFSEMESPSANPQVAFQPIMCQHCNHAPCETVCPVAASSHGRQGQNHMAYNRCVGTRYCANNCPYKVRRFNWFLYNGNDEFDYYMNNDLGRMVINPDVTVRSRGVMEKCSMCIQMTQKTILDAKRDGRLVNKNEFKTACSAACNNGAMVFGDINNKDNDIVRLKNDERAYHLLESVGTKPNVVYQTKVRNTKK